MMTSWDYMKPDKASRCTFPQQRPGKCAIIYNAYEPKVVALFTSLLRKDSVVFDIGAWIGNYTLLAATKAKQVIALETNLIISLSHQV